jgi:2-keto-4-pentenoate hydratase/2-oxohepta-3-ene-1,7-dioic acid hydratase in catechol pathway
MPMIIKFLWALARLQNSAGYRPSTPKWETPVPKEPLLLLLKPPTTVIASNEVRFYTLPNQSEEYEGELPVIGDR